MATAQVVYTSGNSNGNVGTLFEGRKFWLSHNIPQRKRFIELIQNNGGLVVPSEKNADIKLVDHTKRDIPLNTYSYQYVEKSIRNGTLESLEAHRAGKTTRPVAAYGVPTRQHRMSYTLEDDQILWDWVHPYEERGEFVAGNIIYQQLEQQHPRHTFQSWRDRYLRKLRGCPRPGGPAPANQNANADLQPPEQVDTRQHSSLHQTDAVNGSLQRVENSAAPGRQKPTDISPPKSSLKAPGSPRRALVTSGRERSSQVVKFRESPPSQPHTPDIPDGRSTSFNIPLAPTDSTSSMGQNHSSTITRIGRPTVTQDNPNKRKRLSADDAPTTSSFAADHLSKRQRRATDFIPRPVPSTPDQSYRNRPEIQEEPLRDSTADETNTTNFETAPKFQPSSKAVPAQSQTTDTLEDDEEENLNALMELPFPPLETELGEESDDDDDGTVHDLDEWIAERLRTGKAKNEMQIITALRCTSMNPELADRVLDSLTAGNGIPRHMQGVWTPEDDASMEGTDARDIDRLLKKHGTVYYNARYEYLSMLQAAGRK